MTNGQKTIILEALELKETSVKRAQKTNSNPIFKPAYETALAELGAARAEITKLKVTD